MTRTGLDRIAAGEPEALKRVRGRKLGLVAHPASIALVDGRFMHAHDVLVAQGCDVRALFGPEHGYGGHAQDMIAVVDEERGSSRASDDAEHVKTAPDVRMHSLYGASEADLSPKREWLEGLDAVVIDLQDVGSRYYTFVWTAVLMLRACASAGVQTIVLDRPNPLGGVIVEGGPQRPGYRSFVGLHDVAVRHGMTIAEICRLGGAREGVDAGALEIIELLGYARDTSFADTGLPWVLPSPNMPTLDTALVYPGGCLLEGTNLSEGRGTTRPFEIFGAPFVDGEALAREVSVEGAMLRPLHFEPTFHKHGKQRCGGVQVHVTDPRVFAPYAAYARLIAACARMSKGAFAFRTDTYEYVSDRPALDILVGGPELRQCVEQGAPVEDWLADDARSAARFADERRPFLLYG
jgi:uncharacterized protein YbbC (DUF1343 family)